MPVIHVLSPHVADLIAAGEVVRAPRLGGQGAFWKTRWTPERAPSCLSSAPEGGLYPRHGRRRRHGAGGRGRVLSAPRDEQALGRARTRGHRHARLSRRSSRRSAPFSRITLTTRRRGAAMGVRVEVEAGEIVSMEETGCPEGTTITVRDLFYNTPARQKFLGTDRSECRVCAERAARRSAART